MKQYHAKGTNLHCKRLPPAQIRRIPNHAPQSLRSEPANSSPNNNLLTLAHWRVGVGIPPRIGPIKQLLRLSTRRTPESAEHGHKARSDMVLPQGNSPVSGNGPWRGKTLVFRTWFEGSNFHARPGELVHVGHALHFPQ
jgi:hypothetical protein